MHCGHVCSPSSSPLSNLVSETRISSDSAACLPHATEQQGGYAKAAHRLPYSIPCYTTTMSERGELLHEAMTATGTSQRRLSLLSGVHQPSISQFISGRVDFSDAMLSRLLECMGLRLQVTRRSVPPELTRAEHRSWRLHQQLALHLSTEKLDEWRPAIESRLDHLGLHITGQPHSSNVSRWRQLVSDGDLRGIRHALTGLDRHSIEMREVSPLGGFLPQEERQLALASI